MSRLAKSATRSGSRAAAFTASFPTTTALESNSTTLGVMASPSLLGIVHGRPVPSRCATTENVVPRSIPTGTEDPAILALRQSCTQPERQSRIFGRPPSLGPCKSPGKQRQIVGGVHFANGSHFRQGAGN